MTRPQVNDLDYLAARVHGRRSRVAEGARLEALCRVRQLAALSEAVCPGVEIHSAAELQRRLVEDLVRELSSMLTHLEGPGAALLAWILVRFQVENMKVLARGFVNRTPVEVLREHLATLPHDFALNAPALATAQSLDGFVEWLPLGPPRQSLRALASLYHDQSRPFFLEAALDQGYLQELLTRAGQLSGEDKDLIQPMALQEVDAFHLMLVVRGRFNYGLAPASLLPLHVRWSGIPSERFSAMLAAPDLPTAAGLAVGRAIDVLPAELGTSETAAAVDAATLEALCWKRFLRLAQRAVRRSHMGLGSIFGYVGIRRVEVANLITLSEGIRTGAAEEAIRKRLVPRAGLEAAHA